RSDGPGQSGGMGGVGRMPRGPDDPAQNGASAGGAIGVVSVVEPVPSAAAPEVIGPLPDAPLVRLDPVTARSTASPGQIAPAVDLRLQLIGALAAAAIAEAWDTGR